jgi:hypothetical protein
MEPFLLGKGSTCFSSVCCLSAGSPLSSFAVSPGDRSALSSDLCAFQVIG